MNKIIAAVIFLLGAGLVSAENYNSISVQGQLIPVQDINDVNVHILADSAIVGTASDVDLLPDASGYFSVFLRDITPADLFRSTNTAYDVRFSTGGYEIATAPLTSVPFAKALKGASSTDNIIAAVGNIGIGTTTPAYRLHVSSGAGATGTILSVSTGTSEMFYVTGSGGVYASKYYGDGSALTGITGTGDNLGDHTATQPLQMGQYAVNTSSDITAARYQIAGSTVLALLPGSNSLGIGVDAGSVNTGDDNMFIGYKAGYERADGARNIFLGNNAGYFSNDGSLNVYVGVYSGLNIGGDENTFVGDMTGANTLSGNGNIFIGRAAGSYTSVTQGDNNIFLGGYAGSPHVGSNNIIIGVAEDLSGYYASNELNVGGVLYGNLLNKTIGISKRAPEAALDVVSTGTAANQMAQIWRDSNGVVKSSMSATGVMMAAKYVGDGSGLTGLTATIGDNLGNHIATTTLNMSGFNIMSANSISASAVSLTGSVTASSFTATNASLGVDTAKIRFGNNNIIASVASSSQYGGIYVSTHIYVNGTLYGDGSGLSNITAPGDNLGNHTALEDIKMQGYQILNVGTITVTGTNSSGYSLGLSSGIYMPNGTVLAGSFNGNGSSLSSLNASNLTSGTIADGRLSANVSLLDADQTINGIKTFTSSVTVTNALGVYADRYMLNTGFGISSASASQLGGLYVSSNVFIAGVSSATKYYGDGSGLTGITVSGDNLGNHKATTSLDLVNNQIMNISSLTITGNAFSVGGSTLVVVDGKVGVGVTNPGQKLDVYGNVRSKNSDISTLLSQDGLYGYGATDMYVQAPTNYDLLLNSSGGNVGIGTANPTKKLEVVGDASVSGTLDLGRVTVSSNSANNYAIATCPSGKTASGGGGYCNGGSSVPIINAINSYNSWYILCPAATPNNVARVICDRGAAAVW